MLKKMEYDYLAAQLSAVESLLEGRTAEDSPIGFLQFTDRKAELEAELAAFGACIDPYADIGIYFDGESIRNQRGLDAAFAGKMLQTLQSLIALRYAMMAGPLDPATLAQRSRMLVMVLPYGAGFALEQAEDAPDGTRPLLQTVVNQLIDIVARAGAAADWTSAVDAAAYPFDHAAFTHKLAQFFTDLDEQEASVRLFSDGKTIELDRAAVSLARSRLQALAMRPAAG